MTDQPRWKCTANLGDVNPVDEGGYFVLEDETGQYPAELEVLGVQDEDGRTTWTVHRFPLERCTCQDGILSDNPQHPEHPAWFADSIGAMARFADMAPQQLAAWFCSQDAKLRAEAYRLVGLYHGWENLDQYPLTFNRRAEVKARYREYLK